MMGTLICLTALLSGLQVGLASRFGDPGDRYSGHGLSCRYHMNAQRFRAAVAQGCAHRRLPCGTQLLVTSAVSRKSTACTVVDRGPYGAMHRGRWVLKRSARDPGSWRGILDLLPATANRLGLRGIHPIVLKIVGLPRPAAPRFQRGAI